MIWSGLVTLIYKVGGSNIPLPASIVTEADDFIGLENGVDNLGIED